MEKPQHTTDRPKRLGSRLALARRPLFLGAASLTLGLILGRDFLPPLPQGLLPVLWVWAAALAAAGVWERGRLNLGSAACCFAAAGLLAGLARVQPMKARLESPNPPSRQGLWLEGRVVEDLGRRVETRKHVLLLDRVAVAHLAGGPGPAEKWRGRVRISYDGGAAGEKALRLGPGDRIGFFGSLWFAEPPTNPGQFDYRAYQYGRGITASAGPRGRNQPVLLGYEGGLGLFRLAWKARLRLEEAFARHLPPRLAAIANGAILGDKSGLESRDIKAYTRSGLAYLLAVSGLHLGLALALFLAVAAMATPSRRAQSILALVAVAAYALITGLQVPAQRSACLFLLVLLARAADLKTDFAVSLAFGAVLVLLAQPGALWEAGFQLSFLVTASIVFVGRHLAALLERWMPLRLAQFFGIVWSAQLAVVPLTAYHFHQFTWPAFVSDGSVAWAMPLIIALGLGAGLADLLWQGLAQVLAWPLGWCLWWLDTCNRFFATLPGAVFSVGSPSYLLVFLWAAFAAALARHFLNPPQNPKAAFLMLGGLLLATLWPGLPFNHRHAGHTRAWFLDVGQGDCVLVEFGDGKTLLVDAGTARPDSGSWVVEPALRALGISGVDWVALSHPHADHVGGLKWVAEQMPLGAVFHSGWQARTRVWRDLGETLAAHKVPLLAASREHPPQDWEGRIRVLSPGSPKLKGSKHDMHNNGLSIQVEDWLLLTGDMGVEGEAGLLRRGLIAPVAVFKAAHHGSRTSNSAALLKKAAPAHAVIQAGRRGIYGHPHQEAMDSFAGAGVTLWRNDQHGCVSVEWNVEKGAAGISPWVATDPARLWQVGRRPPRVPWKQLEASGAMRRALEAAQERPRARRGP